MFSVLYFHSLNSAFIFFRRRSVQEHVRKYKVYFNEELRGQLGPTAQYWTMYVYMVNRVHRELQRTVRTNDVRSYISILDTILNLFFALNRPIYARWATLFLSVMKNANPTIREILDKGAFSIRRTHRNYARTAVDLSLEQTYNRDAASALKGIVAFRNSEGAMRRWSLNKSQRTMAVTELREMCGLEKGETSASHVRKARVQRDKLHNRHSLRSSRRLAILSESSAKNS